MIKYEIGDVIFVNRLTYIQEVCQGKKVLNLGATADPDTQIEVEKGIFLHSLLTEVSEEVIGMDISVSMITWLKKNCGITNIQYGNIEIYEDYPKQEFDVIVAGEIFEHLSNSGKALDCLRKISKTTTKLIITVPNAYSIKGFLRAVAKHELIHPDHTLHHSFHTLKALLERHGFYTETSFSFVNGGAGIMASITNFLLQFSPQLAEGIGVVCSLNREGES